MNHDGNPDLVIDAGSFQLWVLLGNGNVTFQPSNTGYRLESVRICIWQLRLRHEPGFSRRWQQWRNPSVGIRRGNGNGSFQVNEAYIIFPGEGVGGVAVGDMNGDGKSDIITGTTGHVGVLLGNGNGTFYGPSNTLASAASSLITLGDFNRDGTNDVAAGNYDTGKITIFLGTGNGSLRSNAVYSVGVSTCKHSQLRTSMVMARTIWWRPAAAPSRFYWATVTALFRRLPAMTDFGWQSPRRISGSRATNGGTVQMTVPSNQQRGFFRLHQQ